MLLFNQIHTNRLRGLNLPVEEFVCGWLPLADETIWRVLSMPALRILKIRTDAHALVRILKSQPMKAPQLTSLKVHCKVENDGLNSLASMLTLMLPSRLTKFSIISPGSICRTSELRELLRAAGRHCSPELLTRFSLQGNDFADQPSDEDAVIDFKMIEPMLPFSNLRKVEFQHQQFELSDSEFKTLAMSWPLIEDFSFEVRKTPEPKATLRGLLWLAKLNSLAFNFTDMISYRTMLS